MCNAFQSSGDTEKISFFGEVALFSGCVALLRGSIVFFLVSST